MNCHALALALDDEPRRDRLHAPGRQSLHDLPPEHRRDLVAVEAVEDAPRLLRVDEARVDVARLGRARARSPARVISWKTIRRTGTFGFSSWTRCQAIASPSRSSSVASRSSSASFSFAFRSATTFFFRGVDDVERLEVVVDVDAEARPRLVLVLRGDLGGVVRAGRGCGRSTTRRCSPRRGSRRSSSPWQATRRSRASFPWLLPFRAPP